MAEFVARWVNYDFDGDKPFIPSTSTTTENLSDDDDMPPLDTAEDQYDHIPFLPLPKKEYRFVCHSDYPPPSLPPDKKGHHDVNINLNDVD